jgi:hypothetical protein
VAAGLLLNGSGDLCAEQLSEGQPHKWEVNSNQRMYDFVSNIFELKSVPCDKQSQTSYYWYHKLAKAHTAQWARWCDDRTHLLIG